MFFFLSLQIQPKKHWSLLVNKYENFVSESLLFFLFWTWHIYHFSEFYQRQASKITFMIPAFSLYSHRWFLRWSDSFIALQFRMNRVLSWNYHAYNEMWLAKKNQLYTASFVTFHVFLNYESWILGLLERYEKKLIVSTHFPYALRSKSHFNRANAMKTIEFKCQSTSCSSL